MWTCLDSGLRHSAEQGHDSVLLCWSKAHRHMKVSIQYISLLPFEEIAQYFIFQVEALEISNCSCFIACLDNLEL